MIKSSFAPALAAAVAIFTISSHSAPAAEAAPILLKSKLAVGKTYNFRQDVVMKMELPLAGAGESATKMSMDLAMKVAKAPEGDNKLVSTKFTQVKMEMDMAGQKMVYDSTDPAKQSPLLKAQFAGLSDQEFKAVYDKDDKFLKMEGGGGGGGAGLGMGFGNNEIQQMLQQLTDYGFPAEPVKPGDKWSHKQEAKMGQMGNMEMNMEFTYKGPVERDGKTLANIAITGTIGGGDKAEGALIEFKDSTLSGNMLFDNELGAMHSSDMDMNMTMAVGGAGGAEMDSKTKSSYKLLSVE